jgi:chemotaxis protein CheX
MKPDETQVRSVVRSVWSTQLGLEIQDADGPPPAPTSPTLTAAIHIGGDFHGAIRLECSRALIRRAAAIMFAMPESELTVDDDCDVVGELTNVVAGNLKALLPGSNSISLPTIIDGSDYKVSTLNVASSEDFGFTLDGEKMIVTVVEHGRTQP